MAKRHYTSNAINLIQSFDSLQGNVRIRSSARSRSIWVSPCSRLHQVHCGRRCSHFSLNSVEQIMENRKKKDG